MPQNRISENRSKQLSIFDEIDAIIMAPPSWLVHSGLSLFGVFLVSTLLMAWFIQYPVTITVAATVTPEQAPLSVSAPQSGIIRKAFCTNLAKVEQGDMLFFLGDDANLDEINTASLWCASQSWELPLPILVNLGKLGAAWLEVSSAQQNFLTYQVQARPNLAVREVERQVALTKKLERADRTQALLSESELALVTKEYERNSQLYLAGVISLKEMEVGAQTLQAAKRQLEATKMQSTEKQLRKHQLSYERQKLQSDYHRRLSELQLALREKATAFLVATEAWKQMHLVCAPSEGLISALVEIRENHLVQKDQPLVWLVLGSDTAMQLVAICKVPQSGTSEMQVGNEVRLRLDAYPEEEYGHLFGEILKMGAVAIQDDDGNLYQEVVVKISNRNKTSAGKALPFRPNLSAQAEIIMRKRRLLERMLFPVVNALEKLQK